MVFTLARGEWDWEGSPRSGTLGSDGYRPINTTRDHAPVKPFGRKRRVGSKGNAHACIVHLAAQEGWDRPGMARLRNGDLLDAAEAAAFDALLTTDKNLRYQQNLAGRKIAVIGAWQTVMAEFRPYRRCRSRTLDLILVVCKRSPHHPGLTVAERSLSRCQQGGSHRNSSCPVAHQPSRCLRTSHRVCFMDGLSQPAAKIRTSRHVAVQCFKDRRKILLLLSRFGRRNLGGGGFSNCSSIVFLI